MTIHGLHEIRRRSGLAAVTMAVLITVFTLRPEAQGLRSEARGPRPTQTASASSIDAQTSATSAVRTRSAPNRLPVRRVVLYKSGVGYFEHLGKVRGNQTVTIDFTSGQLDDVLKSLTTLDLDGGRVSGVSYNS